MEHCKQCGEAFVGGKTVAGGINNRICSQECHEDNNEERLNAIKTIMNTLRKEPEYNDELAAEMAELVGKMLEVNYKLVYDGTPSDDLANLYASMFLADHWR